MITAEVFSVSVHARYRTDYGHLALRFDIACVSVYVEVTLLSIILFAGNPGPPGLAGSPGAIGPQGNVHLNYETLFFKDSRPMQYCLSLRRKIGL